MRELVAHAVRRRTLWALVHAALGERDAAFEWLQRAYDEQYGPLVFRRVDPDLDGVRGDPRFDALVAQIRRPTT